MMDGSDLVRAYPMMPPLVVNAPRMYATVWRFVVSAYPVVQCELELVVREELARRDLP